ncbi:GGDEF domain-containing protein [Pseudoalteromonas luteoviolacea]|uniref:GGDEF domain-containing protein n=1 Tax=Pseudoalteromonas luteoviolacea TaxID=43657 RepID=UPI0012BC4305|nr:GGDEF domain-containing protein [Pseudoalteromonas luteoviolacea]
MFIVTAAVLIYYPIRYALDHRYGLAIAVVIVIAALLFTAVRLFQGRLSVLKCLLLSTVLGSTLIYFSFQSPIIAVIWLPAFLVGVFMVFPFKIACLTNITFWLIITYLNFIHLHIEIALRSAMSSGLIMLLTAVIVKTYNEAIQVAESVATKDPLTGALNRRTLIENIELESERVTRYGQTCSIIMIDLDNFKTLNDKLGHGIGDEMLVNFVKLISQYTRKNDKLFRLGGDEFMLLIPGMDAQTAQTFIARIQNLVPAQLTVEHVALGMSFGVCEITADTAVEQLLELADQALYQNKAQRKKKQKDS